MCDGMKDSFQLSLSLHKYLIEKLVVYRECRGMRQMFMLFFFLSVSVCFVCCLNMAKASFSFTYQVHRTHIILIVFFY